MISHNPDVYPADAKQQMLTEWFGENAELLEEIGHVNLRAAYDQEVRLIFERAPIDKREQTIRELLQNQQSRVGDLSKTFSHISSTIPRISVHKDERIHPEKSTEYVSQEIVREELKDTLGNWLQDYRIAREKVSDLRNRKQSTITQQESICYAGYEHLCEHLSNLSPEKEYQRACYVLRRIQLERARIMHEILCAPIRGTYELSAKTVTLLSSLVDVTHGLVMGIIELSAEYGIHISLRLQEWKRLAHPAHSSDAFIKNFPENDQSLKERYFREVDDAMKIREYRESTIVAEDAA